jgi:hypothetical protein
LNGVIIYWIDVPHHLNKKPIPITVRRVTKGRAVIAACGSWLAFKQIQITTITTARMVAYPATGLTTMTPRPEVVQRTLSMRLIPIPQFVLKMRCRAFRQAGLRNYSQPVIAAVAPLYIEA